MLLTLSSMIIVAFTVHVCTSKCVSQTILTPISKYSISICVFFQRRDLVKPLALKRSESNYVPRNITHFTMKTSKCGLQILALTFDLYLWKLGNLLLLNRAFLGSMSEEIDALINLASSIKKNYLLKWKYIIFVIVTIIIIARFC